jgi:hypothetical protein
MCIILFFKYIYISIEFIFFNSQHDDVLERQGPRGLNAKTNPVPINPILAKSAKYNLNMPDQFQAKLFSKQTEEEETEHFVRLCRGEKLRVWISYLLK